MARSVKNLIAAMLIAISAYMAWVEIWPEYSIIYNLKEQIQEKNNLLASRTEIIQKIGKLRNERNSKDTELQRLALVLPEERDFPEIITALDNIYSRSGVILPELLLDDPKGSEGLLGVIHMKTVSNATYQQFLTLLSYIEKNIRLLDINAMTLNLPISEVEKNNSDPLLSFILEGQFYWLKSGSLEADQVPTVQ